MARTLALGLFVALLSGCGSQKPPATAEGEGNVAESKADSKPEETNPTEGGADEAKGGDAADAKPTEAKPTGPAKAPSEAESLARDIVKGGGRRIGYSATKKMFVVPYEKRNETSFSLDVHFYGEDGASRDPMRVCQPGECEEHLDEILKEFLPKLATKLEEGGYVAIRGIGWPDNRDELEVSSLGMKLKYSNGRMEGLKDGKKTAAFTVVGGRLDASGLKAIFVVPDSKLLGVFVTPAKEPGVVQTFHLLKMP